jgi:hypothetical protein
VGTRYNTHENCRLRGRYGELAKEASGSHCVEKCFAAADIKLKEVRPRHNMVCFTKGLHLDILQRRIQICNLISFGAWDVVMDPKSQALEVRIEFKNDVTDRQPLKAMATTELYRWTLVSPPNDCHPLTFSVAPPLA